MKKIFSIVVYFLLGIFLFGFGVVMLTENEVSCGGQVMSEGDQCVEYKNGVKVGTNSLAEQQASDKRNGFIGLAMGAAFVAVGGWQVRKMVANKASAPAA